MTPGSIPCPRCFDCPEQRKVEHLVALPQCAAGDTLVFTPSHADQLMVNMKNGFDERGPGLLAYWSMSRSMRRKAGALAFFCLATLLGET